MTMLASTPRRSFLQRLAALSAAFATGGRIELAPPLTDAWLDRITGKHRQLFDCTSANDGFGAAFALNFIDGYKQTLNLTDKDMSAVVVYRHFAMPLMLNDAMWAKYHIGEVLKINDSTGKPATKNIFHNNIFGRPGLTYEQAIKDRGLIMVACNLALTVISGMAAPKAGVTADQAKAEWTANLLPGVVLAPSGVYAVSRAQEKSCTYCYGG